jgi:hypothetical protein
MIPKFKFNFWFCLTCVFCITDVSSTSGMSGQVSLPPEGTFRSNLMYGLVYVLKSCLPSVMSRGHPGPFSRGVQTSLSARPRMTNKLLLMTVLRYIGV